jgi:hypothetical protein
MQDDLNIEIVGTLAEGESEGKGAQARSPKTGWEEVESTAFGGDWEFRGIRPPRRG